MEFKPTRYFQNLHNPSDVMASTLLTNILVVYRMYTIGLASKAEDVLKIVFNNYTLDAIAILNKPRPQCVLVAHQNLRC